MDPNHSVAFRKRSLYMMSFIQTGYWLCIWLIFLHSSLNGSALQWKQWVSLRKDSLFLHFTSFSLPSVFLCYHSLPATLGAPLWQSGCSDSTTLQESQSKLQPLLTTASKVEVRVQDLITSTVKESHLWLIYHLLGLADCPLYTCYSWYQYFSSSEGENKKHRLN